MERRAWEKKRPFEKVKSPSTTYFAALTLITTRAGRHFKPPHLEASHPARERELAKDNGKKIEEEDDEAAPRQISQYGGY